MAGFKTLDLKVFSILEMEVFIMSGEAG